MAYVEVRSLNLMVGPALRRLIQQQVDAALHRFGQQVRHVIVRLADLNGPRGGIGRHCTVALALSPSGMVTAEATESKWQKSFHRALRRVVRQIPAAGEIWVAMRVRSAEGRRGNVVLRKDKRDVSID